MYYFPFLLLTPDNGRNEAIADRLEEEMKMFRTNRPAATDDAMRGLYLLQDNADAILIRVARSNLSAFADEMPALDHHRARDKLKRVLLTLRRMIPDMQHDWPVPGWLDSVAPPTPVDLNDPDFSVPKANSEFLTRLSSLHHQIFLLARHGADHILASRAAGRHADQIPDDMPKKLAWMEKAVAAVNEYTRFLNML
jgi:hypothetical protein